MAAGDLKPLLGRLAAGERLTEEEAEGAFGVIMSGDATPAQMGAFLMALRVRGETVPELTGAVRAMRAKMLAISAPPEAIDLCGTGGDAHGTLNISTCSQFVVAGAGVPVAKHGNRALSSKAGAADVLAALGIRVEVAPGELERQLRDVGTCFLMAPRHHSAMRHVGPTRVELGTRTIFNLMGPMTNPAGVTRQLIGVFAAEWLRPMAEALRALGSRKVWLVHGADGLDELSTTGVNKVVQLVDGEIDAFDLDPASLGLAQASLADLRGGEPEANATRLLAVLEGTKDAYREVVLLNAAAALFVADKVPDLAGGLELAAKSIDDGKARDVLRRLVADGEALG